MASFNLDTWCTATKLTETSVDILKKEDLVTEEALQLLTPTDLEKLYKAEHRAEFNRFLSSVGKFTMEKIQLLAKKFNYVPV